MEHCEVRHGRIEAILISDPVDVKEAYSQGESAAHSLHRHVQSYGWNYASFGYEEDSVGGGHRLRGKLTLTEAVQLGY